MIPTEMVVYKSGDLLEAALALDAVSYRHQQIPRLHRTVVDVWLSCKRPLE